MLIKKVIRPLVIPLVLVGLQVSAMAATEGNTADTVETKDTDTSTLSSDTKPEGRLVVTCKVIRISALKLA